MNGPSSRLTGVPGFDLGSSDHDKRGQDVDAVNADPWLCIWGGTEDFAM